MVSPASSATGVSEKPAKRHGCPSGMVTFAGVLVFILALFNGLNGIAGINRSHVFVDGAHIVVGDLRAWGWTLLVLGILLALIAAGILAGSQLARWVGVAVLSLNAFSHMWVVSSYPLWSVLIIVLDILAIYALCVHGDGHEHEGAAH
ncbi:hypothetical protein [Streptomyces sp. FH025]|uniref:DUF7144 family membrane protein n=1 Tax=Streptomyces sp. FH025 TaxID=2815937 RepID=UPI001A9CFF30|nr:hypothetical protein [Streptomyces sp. FH025]MBO1414564.1 hypothetical protein [Streptomyces sp. FH025]